MNMFTAKAAILAIAVAVASTAQADDRTEANRLFVEAIRINGEAAASQDLARRAALYQRALQRLERIVAEHPGSDIAVRLVSNDNLGGLSLPLLRAQSASAALQNEVSRVNPTLQEQAATIALLEKETQTLFDVIDNISPRLTQAMRERDVLEARVADLKSERPRTGGQYRRWQGSGYQATDVADLEKQTQVLYDIIDTMSPRLVAAETERDALKARVAALETGRQPAGRQSRARRQASGYRSPAPAKPAAAPTAPRPLSAWHGTLALRDTLRVASATVTEKLGRRDGFNADPQVHVPLPGALGVADKALGAIGMGQLTQDLELRLNRSAESAAAKSKPLLWQAIANMSLTDANAIVKGSGDAATRHLRDTMSPTLTETLRPVVIQSLSDSGATRAYDSLIGRYNAIPFTKEVQVDITEHVLRLTLRGLFHYLGAEETAIRTDPSKRSTGLQQSVFGATQR